MEKFVKGEDMEHPVIKEKEYITKMFYDYSFNDNPELKEGFKDLAVLRHGDVVRFRLEMRDVDNDWPVCDLAKPFVGNNFDRVTIDIKGLAVDSYAVHAGDWDLQCLTVRPFEIKLNDNLKISKSLLPKGCIEVPLETISYVTGRRDSFIHLKSFEITETRENYLTNNFIVGDKVRKIDDEGRISYNGTVASISKDGIVIKDKDGKLEHLSVTKETHAVQKVNLVRQKTKAMGLER